MTEIKKIIEQCAFSKEQIQQSYKAEFELVYEREKDWLTNTEVKTYRLSPQAKEAVDYVISKLKIEEFEFTKVDGAKLEIFVGQINRIIRIANRINNFKEGTFLDNGDKLELYLLFNKIKKTASFSAFNFTLNKNLNSFIVHLFSVVKHCQDPSKYPIYYKYWKNILGEVLKKQDDYDSLTEFYQSFDEPRHINLGAYFGVIGTLIAKKISDAQIIKEENDKTYNHVKNKLLNIHYFDLITGYRRRPNYFLIGSKYGEKNNVDMFPQMLENNVISVGFAPKLDLSDFYLTDVAEISEYLKDQGENQNSINALRHFLSLKIGDRIAVKSSGSPKAGKGFLSIIGICEVVKDDNGDVYKYDPENLFHTINVKFLEASENKEFELGGYGSTIHHLSNESHIRLIFGESNSSIIDDSIDIKTSITKKENMHPLNTIFYGPPGTGKTYHTVLRAAEIIEDRKIQKYEDALKIFKENLGNRIEFITFHQNYSYEDFIQGLRPETENNSSLTFKKHDGVFKKIVDRAINNPYYIPVGTILKDYKVIKSNSDVLELWSEKTNSIRYVPLQLVIDLYEGILSGKITLEDIKKRKDLDLPALINSKVEKYFFGIEGTLYNICEFLLEKKKSNEKQNYVIVIDEINRANISRVFGELITLIEPDKRSEGDIPMTVTLPSGDSFMVPSNLYIIGTMNTADKSIALLDIALRRRFNFEPMYPQYEIEGDVIHNADVLKKINDYIVKSKGHDFQIGHAYFMRAKSDLKTVMNQKVIPLLMEYYMNDSSEVKNILLSAGLKFDANDWPLKVID